MHEELLLPCAFLASIAVMQKVDDIRIESNVFQENALSLLHLMSMLLQCHISASARLSHITLPAGKMYAMHNTY